MFNDDFQLHVHAKVTAKYARLTSNAITAISSSTFSYAHGTPAFMVMAEACECNRWCTDSEFQTHLCPYNLIASLHLTNQRVCLAAMWCRVDKNLRDDLQMHGQM